MITAESPRLQADLAWALDNLAAILSAAEQDEAALPAAAEAIDIYRRLSPVAGPSPPNHAWAARRQADRLARLGRPDEAIASATEALALQTEQRAAGDGSDDVLAEFLVHLEGLLTAAGCTDAADSLWDDAARPYGESTRASFAGWRSGAREAGTLECATWPHQALEEPTTAVSQPLCATRRDVIVQRTRSSGIGCGSATGSTPHLLPRGSSSDLTRSPR